MWKICLISAMLLLMVTVPVFAITQDEIDLINAELGKIAVKTVETPTDKKGWDAYDTTLLMLRVIDWGQTREIASNKIIHYSYETNNGTWVHVPETTYYTYKELNPILGKQPSLEEVNTYFITCIGIDILVATYADQKLHKWWQIVSMALETYCVTNNWQLGIKCNF